MCNNTCTRTIFLFYICLHLEPEINPGRGFRFLHLDSLHSHCTTSINTFLRVRSSSSLRCLAFFKMVFLLVMSVISTRMGLFSVSGFLPSRLVIIWALSAPKMTHIFLTIIVSSTCCSTLEPAELCIFRRFRLFVRQFVSPVYSCRFVHFSLHHLQMLRLLYTFRDVIPKQFSSIASW